MTNYREFISNLPFDISVEALAGSVLENNDDLSLEQVRVRPMGHINRAAAREVLDISGSEFDREGKEIIYIDINREGLFDSLPEMLFYSQETFEDEAEKAQYIAKQRENAHSFFLPFGEEFYKARIELELRERTALRELNARLLHIYGLNLNGISRESQKEILLFAFALPFLKEIVGNMELTCSVLEAIVKKKVIVSSEPPRLHEISESLQSKVGNINLGDDLLLGGMFSDGIRCLEFSICDVSPAEIEKWIPGGAMRKLIEEKLFPYILPAGENYYVNILIINLDNGLILGDDMSLNILGYTKI